MTDVSPTPPLEPAPVDPAPEPTPPLEPAPVDPAPASPTPVIDKLEAAAADVLHRLRLAATSSQVETVKSWVRETFG